MKVRGGDPYIRKLRAELRIKKGDLRGAVEDLTAATDSDAVAPDVHLQKGLLLTLRGEDAGAETEFAAHLQMFPAARDYLNGRVEEAKKLRAGRPRQ